MLITFHCKAGFEILLLALLSASLVLFFLIKTPATAATIEQRRTTPTTIPAIAPEDNPPSLNEFCCGPLVAPGAVPEIPETIVGAQNGPLVPAAILLFQI